MTSSGSSSSSTNSAFMDNLRQLFAECDSDQNGSLGRREFSELCGKIGLNPEAAAETFDRLDVDRDDKITFDEFAAGFNQYKAAGSAGSSASASASPSPSASGTSIKGQPSPTPPTEVPQRFLTHHHQQQRAHQRPTSSQGQHNKLSPSPKKAASPIGVLSLGSTGSSASSQSSASTSGASHHLTSSRSASSGLHNHLLGQSDGQQQQQQRQNCPIAGSGPTSMDMMSSSGGGGYADNQSNNMIVYSGIGSNDDYYATDQASGSGQFGSLLSSGSVTSYTQVKTMQDLLECVQKLQNENQILTQIFFKDKREREEYISQLGEEFDQQLREVEERANRRARDELENEKKRLSEMMQTERETLQNHYQTLEKMSKFVRSPNGKLDDGETIDKVKSKLEDTFMENRQLKRSLLDTKSDVALIWKEMEKLKKQYEDKLSSAYEKHTETKNECDHIKQQLNLMKDSNRKLQDASDVIANYITDKVEPVIKVANYGAAGGSEEFGADSNNFLSPNRLANSPASSRRGSILSEYLEGNQDDHDIDTTTKANNNNNNNNCASSAGDVESMASSQGIGPSSDCRPPTSRDNLLTGGTAETATKTTSASEESADKTPDTKGGPLKSIGKHFLLGAGRTQSDAKAKELATTHEGQQQQQQQATSAKLALEAKSMSADQQASDEPNVEPADGPSKATFNIILVGDSFVGKSSFAARFMEGSFVQGLISNCSIDFKTKSYKVDGVNYTVNLWDTAGQERFRSITASYFRKADGIILMYDVTDKRSYLNVRNWMSTIADTAAENVAVLLVGNKIDLRQPTNKSKCVPTGEGFKLAKEYDIVFLETSVKTGTNLLPSMGQLIRLIAKNNNREEEDKDRIKLNDKDKRFACMPKNC